jgi:hypothetical protein
MRMEDKTCPKCGSECREIDPRCKKEGCGHKFVMLCEGCGRDVVGFTLCDECRLPGYKRAPFSKDSTPFSGDEWLDYENMPDDEIVRRPHQSSRNYYNHYSPDNRSWNRLKKLNKKLKKQ